MDASVMNGVKNAFQRSRRRLRLIASTTSLFGVSSIWGFAAADESTSRETLTPQAGNYSMSARLSPCILVLEKILVT